MNPAYCPPFRSRVIAALTLVGLILVCVPPAAGQTDVLVVEGTKVGIGSGAASSQALGLAVRGWDPLAIAGKSDSRASCWIRVSSVWQAHALPELTAGAGSQANAVDHIPITGGEWTLAVGAAMDAAGAEAPMRWDNVTNKPWTVAPLPTLNAGTGAAYTVFIRDGTPVRAVIGGWCGETPPAAAAQGATATLVDKRVPVLWKASTNGERVVMPEFGVGLEGSVHGIGDWEAGGLLAVGEGQNAVGATVPQWWTSMDDGETWVNSQLPLPPTTTSGGSDAVCLKSTDGTTFLVAGWAVTTGGATVPLLWEYDPATPAPAWVVEELPIPAGHEMGHGIGIHRRAARTIYGATVTPPGGSPELALWVDDGTGWTMLGPADYLQNPEIGTPVDAAGIDKFGRVATTFIAPPPTMAARAAAAQDDTLAGLLTPVPATGVGGPVRTPPDRIVVSASPNPFQSAVRIGYALPGEVRATVTVHDVAGRLVARLRERPAPAGAERVVYWDGKLRGNERAASGVYFIRVTTPSGVSTAKIVKVE